MDDVLAHEIEAQITDWVREICPDAKGRHMYGGTMFEKTPGVPKTGFGGVFVYTNHVSLAFSFGSELSDPDEILEGNGKFRRHIKLRTLADLHAKPVKAFLVKAIACQP